MPISATGQQVWRLPEGVQLLWRSWDDEAVVYNVASQQTHLLDAFSAAALAEIEATPKTTEELSARLAQNLDTDRAELSARLVEICARFVELGLAEPARQ